LESTLADEGFDAVDAREQLAAFLGLHWAEMAQQQDQLKLKS
jgi:hypothetical protein